MEDDDSNPDIIKFRRNIPKLKILEINDALPDEERCVIEFIIETE